MMVNQSGLKPLGVAVLIQAYDPDVKRGLIALPPRVETQMAMVENRAIVVEVGPAAWMEEGQPRAKVGDKVLVTKHAGFMAVGPADGKQYRLVNDRDIFCGITCEGEQA